MRIALFVGIGGLLIVAAGIAAFFIDQASRQVPLDIPVYPGAEFWGERNVQAGSRDLFYRTTASPEAVAEYYQGKLNEHYGDTRQRCVRMPPEGDNPNSETNPGIVQYQFKCIFDRSGFNSTQFTEVVIYPGRYNPDPFFNAEGLTIVRYGQQWQQ